ncbi:recombination-associated protein RdgC [Undibacterium sp. Di26W]|uniref:recombination-associated protein RdgC n=1 Tax=Undibacterium sp. Di26W TaxID=3413035 RepID=UPI003BF31CB7
MFPKACTLYALTDIVNADTLDKSLRKHQLTPIMDAEIATTGWAPVRDDYGVLAYNSSGVIMMRFGITKRLLPTAVIKDEVKKRCLEREKEQGFAPGRKAVREIKEDAIVALTALAFPVTKYTNVFIDNAPHGNLLMIDSTSNGVINEIIKSLLNLDDKFPIESISLEHSLESQMRAWARGDVPADMTIESAIVLAGSGGSKVAYKNVDIAQEQLEEQFAAGRAISSLSMSYKDKIGFVLTPELKLKSIKVFDTLDEGDAAGNEHDRFHNDIYLAGASLSSLASSLISAVNNPEEDLA